MPTIDAIHLCCPGPSLADLDPARLDGAWVVAVNAAAEVVRADAWVCIDRQAFDLFTPLGDPLRVSMASTQNNLIRHSPARAEEWRRARWTAIAYCPWPDPPKNISSHYNLSGVAGLVYAVNVATLLGLPDVTVHGCDLDGAGDCRGSSCPEGRDAARWAREARTMRWCMQVAAERGVAVRFDVEPAWLRAAQEVAA